MTTQKLQTVLSPKSQTLAKIYASAMLELSKSRLDADELCDELLELRKIISREKDFAKLVATGAMNKQTRVEFIEKVFAGKVSKTIENLLGVLAVNNRLGIFPAIAIEFQKLLAQRAGEIEVKVTTACEMKAEQIEQLKKVLEEVLKAKPILKIAIDSKIIGGIKLQIGDSIYDASIAGDLEILTQKMAHRKIISTDIQG